MAEKKEYVGVISNRNRTRVIMVLVGSNTAKLAEANQGGWKLADAKAVNTAAAEKKTVKSAEGNEGSKPTPEPKEATDQGTGAETEKESEQEKPQSEVPNAPTPEVKKNKGGRPSKKEAK